MRVLVEQYSYKVDDLPKELQGIERESKGGKVSFDRVGYYLDSKIHDCVFILPKVVLWTTDANGNKLPREMVLGKYTPEEFINPDGMQNGKKLVKDEHRFIYEFSTWIYRALLVYKKAFPDNDIILEKQNMSHLGRATRRRKSETLLDVLLSIQDFARENRDFFFFVVKNRHSGLNKINWTRTVSKSSAVIQEGNPLYLSPVNKKRQINFDEELLVIFLSILNYMREKYGFNTKTDLGYELITGTRFDAYVEKGLGKRRLLKIKYKYFSDKALKLWDLCYAFFECEHQIFLSADHEEYLLVKKFDRVFEAMIDELVGSRKEDMPKALTKQEDGKLVDHMYLFQELIEKASEKMDTFYIGDSKYYKYNDPIGRNSVYKQFTYAKNVIQWRLDLFLNSDDSEEMKKDRAFFVDGQTHKIGPVRDDVTEGYDITPNFFISAMMSADLRGGFKDDEIRITTNNGKQCYVLKQFENRLFDRDTLIVTHYDVNFLFVLSLYAQDNAYRKAAWKVKVRHAFRKQIQAILSERYKFWAMTPKVKGAEKAFLRSDFQKVLGKVYNPYPDGTAGQKYYSLALESDTPKAEVDEIKSWLERAFFVEQCSLGDNPEEILRGKVSAPAKVDGYVPMELVVKSRYEQVTPALLKQFVKSKYYVAKCAPAADPPSYDIKRVFLFTGEPKALSAILDLHFKGRAIDKVELQRSVQVESAPIVGAIADELLKGGDTLFDLWSITQIQQV